MISIDLWIYIDKAEEEVKGEEADDKKLPLKYDNSAKAPSPQKSNKAKV